MFAQKPLLAAIAFIALISSLALAQTTCGDGLCEAGEEEYCSQDCTIAQDEAGSFGSDAVEDENTGFAPQPPSKSLSPAVAVGALLVVLLVVAGYAANASGKPTQYWKQRHGHKSAKKK